MTMGPLQFIRANPATQAFDEREERNRLRREEERTFATDEAIRAGLGETERARTDPVVGRLLDVPGAGQTALAVQQQSAERQDEMEQLAITALGRGEMEVYQYWRDRSGMRVPPEIEADARARDLFSRGSLMAYRLYGRDNPGQASRFLETFVQSGGDSQSAFGAAGTPSGRPAITARIVANVDEEVRVLTNSRGVPVTTGLPSGYAHGRDAQGNPVAVPIPGVETGRAPDTSGLPNGYMWDPAGTGRAVPIPGLPSIITGLPDAAPAQAPAATPPAPSQFNTGGALGNPYSGMTDDEIMRELERAEQGLPTTPGLQEPTQDDPFGFGLGGLFPTR